MSALPYRFSVTNEEQTEDDEREKPPYADLPNVDDPIEKLCGRYSMPLMISLLVASAVVGAMLAMGGCN
jgi:hypothetical protein